MARERKLIIASGNKGVGKSYTTFWKEIMPYFIKHKQSVLIMDVNNEYGKMVPNDPDAIKLSKGQTITIPLIAAKDIVKLAYKATPEIRRIVPIYTSDIYDNKGNIISRKGDPIDPDEFVIIIKEALLKFRTGLLLIEDISQSFGSNIPTAIAGAITRNRHTGLDIIMHLQSISPIQTRMWQNVEFIRYHKQHDPVERAKSKITDNYEIFKIVENLVDKQFMEGNERFYVYVEISKRKIHGAYSDMMLAEAIEEYLKEKPNTLRPLLSYVDGNGKKTYTFQQALELKKKELFALYKP